MANQPVCVHSLQVSKILFYYAVFLFLIIFRLGWQIVVIFAVIIPEQNIYF